jgi:hypothetical protein
LAAVLPAEPEQEAAEQREREDGEDGRRREIGDAALVVVDAGAAHGAGGRQLGEGREHERQECGEPAGHG